MYEYIYTVSKKLDVFFFLNMHNRKKIMISSVSQRDESQCRSSVCRGSERKRQRGKMRGGRLQPAQWNRAYGDSQKDSRPGTGWLKENSLVSLYMVQDYPCSGFLRNFPHSILLLLGSESGLLLLCCCVVVIGGCYKVLT